MKKTPNAVTRKGRTTAVTGAGEPEVAETAPEQVATNAGLGWALPSWLRRSPWPRLLPRGTGSLANE